MENTKNIIKPAFKTKGVYARRIDPNKDLINYKSTKLDQMWNIAIGRKEGYFYTIISFTENLDFSKGLINTPILGYGAHYSIMVGELFELVDHHKNRGYSSCEYKDIFYRGSIVKFGTEGLLFSGYLQDDFLRIDINNTADYSANMKFRYIPWI